MNSSNLNLGSSAEARLSVAFSTSDVYLVNRSWWMVSLSSLTNGESLRVSCACSGDMTEIVGWVSSDMMHVATLTGFGAWKTPPYLIYQTRWRCWCLSPSFLHAVKAVQLWLLAVVRGNAQLRQMLYSNVLLRLSPVCAQAAPATFVFATKHGVL